MKHRGDGNPDLPSMGRQNKVGPICALIPTQPLIITSYLLARKERRCIGSLMLTAATVPQPPGFQETSLLLSARLSVRRNWLLVSAGTLLLLIGLWYIFPLIVRGRRLKDIGSVACRSPQERSKKPCRCWRAFDSTRPAVAGRAPGRAWLHGHRPGSRSASTRRHGAAWPASARRGDRS